MTCWRRYQKCKNILAGFAETNFDKNDANNINIETDYNMIMESNVCKLELNSLLDVLSNVEDLLQARSLKLCSYKFVLFLVNNICQLISSNFWKFLLTWLTSDIQISLYNCWHCCSKAMVKDCLKQKMFCYRTLSLTNPHSRLIC